MEIVIGITEMGGFGDVVAAAKAGEALTKQGHNVTYNFHMETAKEKAERIFPGQNFPLAKMPREYEYGKPLIIDVIGASHPAMNRTADIFVGEVDRVYVTEGIPILLQPGFDCEYAYVSTPIVSEVRESAVEEFRQLVPKFYKPFGLDRLPNPGEEDIRDVITENIRLMGSKAVKRALGECERIGVCYTFESSSTTGYLDRMNDAAAGSSERLGVVVLARTDNQERVKRDLDRSDSKYTIIGSDGRVHGRGDSKVLVMVMDTQPQEITTRLFWSAEMPNHVTGGQSLSDAVYGLVFGNGQGFIYEANWWKIASSEGIFKIMKGSDPETAEMFMHCTDLLSPWMPHDKNPLAPVFSSGRQMDTYTGSQREAFLRAFRRSETVLAPDSVTVQGAISKVVERISANPGILYSLRDPAQCPSKHKPRKATGVTIKSKVNGIKW